MANRKGMKPEHARFVKDQSVRSPDGSARLFAKRGDDWQTRRDSLREFGEEFCPCCGQSVNPEMDQFTKATRAVARHVMGSDKPIKPRSNEPDFDKRKANIILGLRNTMRKLEGK